MVTVLMLLVCHHGHHGHHGHALAVDSSAGSFLATRMSLGCVQEKFARSEEGVKIQPLAMLRQK